MLDLLAAIQGVLLLLLGQAQHDIHAVEPGWTLRWTRPAHTRAGDMEFMLAALRSSLDQPAP